jgi:4-oxalocrotonate tautomerase
MPHVVIHCFKADIPKANLDRIQQSLTHLLQQELPCLAEAISVDLQQVEPALWQQQIYQPLIAPRMPDLLRQPAYTY